MKNNGKWVTINGSHIFIEDDQTLEQALERGNRTYKSLGIKPENLTKTIEDRIELLDPKYVVSESDAREKYALNKKAFLDYYKEWLIEPRKDIAFANALRSGNESQYRNIIDHFDQYLNVFPFQEDTLLFRTVPVDDFTDEDEYSDKNYVHTSLSPYTIKEEDRKHMEDKILIVIRAPKGTPRFQLNNYDEIETILGRNLKFKKFKETKDGIAYYKLKN